MYDGVSLPMIKEKNGRNMSFSIFIKDRLGKVKGARKKVLCYNNSKVMSVWCFMQISTI